MAFRNKFASEPAETSRFLWQDYKQHLYGAGLDFIKGYIDETGNHYDAARNVEYALYAENFIAQQPNELHMNYGI